jgi:hypothetical protein
MLAHVDPTARAVGYILSPLRGVFLLAALLLRVDGATAAPPPTRSALERVAVNEDKRTLLLQPSGRPFTPWGFNYDRDYRMRLIEDYWVDEWDTVASDFREMKALGANIVRIHLSVSEFLEAPDKPNAKNVAQLRKLVKLCEEIGIDLDVTGLGMYRKEAAPAWYMQAGEPSRWAMQATFWSVVAEACGGSNAVAWFDLANEPVTPGEKRPDREWAAGHLEKYWYSQFIVLDPAGRDRGEIARAWVRRMTAAIRKHDQKALITVGMLPFSAAAGQPSIGFDGPGMRDVLDLMCVHVYPDKPPDFPRSMLVLERFDVGKPVVIEEYFPFECKAEELPAFVERTKKHASGWIGFYWGQGVDELANSKQPVDVMTRGWLEVFPRMRPNDGR